MREIKIRMWSNNANKYFYNKDSFECLVQQIRFNEGEPFLGVPFDHVKDGMSFEQYTGLKDKNGKEIYEGDILTPIAYAGLTKDKRFKCEVVFKKGMFCFAIHKPFIIKLNPLYTSLGFGKRAGNEYIIVGNIHENPELLTTDI